MKKKSLIVVTSSALAALAMVGIGTNLGGGNIANVIGEDVPCEHVGNHYAALTAGDYTPGIKEYYACCKCHEKFIVNPQTVSYSVDNGTNSTDSRTCPGSLNGTARWGIDGNKLGFWESDCGYVKFASPISATSGKIEVSLTVTCDSPISSKVSLYPTSATNWSSNRLDLDVTVGGTTTVSFDVAGTPSFVSGGSIAGFFISTPLMTWFSVASGSVVGNKGSYVTVNSVTYLQNANPSGTWTDATLPDDVKNTILADSTDSRYAAGKLGTTSPVSSYTCENGTDSTASRTCPGSLNGTARWNISGNQFGFWESDCGYVKFATPLTVTTGSKLEVNLTVTCSGTQLSDNVSVYPITATDWSTNRVDLAVTVGGTSNITIPLTGSTSFVSGTTVPGFFISTPLMTWFSVTQNKVVGGLGSYVTVNSVNLLLNYN